MEWSALPREPFCAPWLRGRTFPARASRSPRKAPPAPAPDGRAREPTRIPCPAWPRGAPDRKISRAFRRSRRAGRSALNREAKTSRRPFHRQSDIVLVQSGRRGARGRDVVQFRELATAIEWVVVVEPVQHGRHPPGEALHLPDPTKADG